MKQFSIRALLAIATTVALLATGCSKESQTGDTGDDRDVQLYLSIDGLDPAPSVSTRATVNETAINDLWVLQFKMSSTTQGILVNKVYIPTITNPAAIKYSSLHGSDMLLYLVANTGDATLFNSTANGTQLITAITTVANVTTTGGDTFPAASSTGLPMAGQSAVVALTPSAKVPITLTRLVSKVSLTVKNMLSEGYPRLTVMGVQLKNVPKIYETRAISTANGFSLYPTLDATKLTDYAVARGDLPAAGATFTYYIAPNMRGIGNNTEERLKNAANCPRDQGPFCTYVEIIGQAMATAYTPPVEVRYQLYLGGNNTNNYNLQSNTAYKVNIELTGISSNDARMLITTGTLDFVQGDLDGDHLEDIGGWRNPAVGDYYYTDGTYSDKLVSNKIANGMIFWIDPVNPKRFKVMSMIEHRSVWTPQQYQIGTAAQNRSNGRLNYAAIKATFDSGRDFIGAPIQETTFAEAFPAPAWCHDYQGQDDKDEKGTWYLPAQDELGYISCAYNDLDPIILPPTRPAIELNPAANMRWNYLLTVGGGIGLNINPQGELDPLGNIYWSSTEHVDDPRQVATINLNEAGPFSKRQEGSLRCIRELPVTVTVTPTVGDYYYADGSFSSQLNASKPVNGLIYYIDPADPTKFKVLALDSPINKLPWAANKNYLIGLGAQNQIDGALNSAAIKAIFDSGIAGSTTITEDTFAKAFPAPAWCHNYPGRLSSDPEGTWFLPSLGELVLIFHAINGATPPPDFMQQQPPIPNLEARQRWDALLTAQGANGAPIPVDIPIWLSNEAPMNNGVSIAKIQPDGTIIIQSIRSTDTQTETRCVRNSY